ncbi:anthrone oxygenase family protein [Kineococcus sp. SYSU DK001]|uniref:anthrone oxygenase family protein n=1 Tax=Kineococcus sp. SYSU DK001 TaxID=3383122 RepID=UPI003D7E2C87
MDPTTTATRAHDVCTAALALAIVPEPFGRRRRAMGFDDYVRHQQRADAVMRRLAPALSVLAMGTGAAATATLARSAPRAAAARAMSVAAVAGAVVLTVRVHVPVNERLRTWRPGAEAPGWRQARARWERAHVVRRGLVVVAAAATAASAAATPTR